MSAAPSVDCDETLATAALTSSAAFAELYRRHQDAIYRYCLRATGNREAAEDSRQQTFMKALVALPIYRGGSFRAWLFAIARNVVVDTHRLNRQTGGFFEFALMADPESGPETHAILAEDARCIRSVLQRLSPAQCEVIELRMAGLTGREIALALGRTHGTIRNLQHRALLRLRELLDDQDSSQWGRDKI